MASRQDVVEVEVKIEASRETVFALLTDPAEMTRWMGVRALLDPAPGGVFEVDVNPEAQARGTFLEVDPPSRVVWSWGWTQGPIEPGSTRVEITLTEDGDHTVVRLVHSDLPVEALAEHRKGWEHYMGRLATCGAGGDPGPDRHVGGEA